MIRVEITKTVWQSTETGLSTMLKPIGTEHAGKILHSDGVQHIEQRQVLLVQEFEDLRIEPIIALLNQLQETPVCHCGHLNTEHEGNIGRCSATLKSIPRNCGCTHYHTLAEDEMNRAQKAFNEARDRLAQRESELRQVIAQRERLHSDVAKLTRSRDSLLRRRKK